MANISKYVIKVAEAEVGYIEKRSNKDLDSKTKNYGRANYTKYGKWIGANGDYWCASFLSWNFYKAYGYKDGKKLLCGAYSPACEVIRQNFIKKGQYHKSNPKVGDVCFFSGSRHKGANHIALVYKVDDKKVYTIEGNTSNGEEVVDNGGMVCKKSYKLSYSRILGYGRPKYNVGATTTTKKPETTQKKISTVKQGVVTASVANVRLGAGTNYSLCKSDELKNGLKKGTKVDVIATKKSTSGNTWYIIRYKGKQGYISSKCLKIV